MATARCNLLELPSSTIKPRTNSSSSHQHLLFRNDSITLLPSSYLTLRLKLKPFHHRPKTPLAITSAIPTLSPDSDASSTGKAPKYSWRVLKSLTMAEMEARKLQYANTGTEALILGILTEGTSLAAKLLRKNGVTIFKVRDEIEKLLRKGNKFFLSPERPPLTGDAQRAIDWAADLAVKSGDGGELTTSHLLLGLWSEADSPAHKILAALGFSDENAKELLSLISKPGFSDE